MPRFRCVIPAVAALALVAVLTVPGAFGQSLGDRKAGLDTRIGSLRDEIEDAKRKEGVLTSEIEAASANIRALEGDIGVLSEKVSRLESQLAVRRERLATLRELYALQTRRLTLLTAAHAEAQRRLEARLVDLYESGEPDELAVFFQAESLDELIEQVKLFNDIAQQDRSIANEIKRVKGEMRVARRKTAAVKAEVAEATRILAEQTAEERAARDRLVAQEAALASARSSKESILTSVKQERHEAEEDLAAMQAASAAITAKIQSAQSQAGAGGVSAGTASSSGLIWPVSGVLTSTYGWRWGRMHEGIDIAAPSGTPIYASAAGTVIYAGWLGGYGNMVIIDHGGGLATAYAHQSAIYVTAGSVSQGQVIGAVGTTGHSTGNHLHFEVRVNGSAVDPLGYL